MYSFKSTFLIRTIWHIYKRYFVNYKKKLGFCAPDVTLFTPVNIVAPQNIFMYENTGIQAGATILTQNAKFIMKKNSRAAAGLFVSTGNHERRVGMFYRKITEKEKKSGLDLDVIVEEDCWIGGNVALLSGVIIRRGTTVANGAVVARSTPPYSIVGGVPAKFIKFYWSLDEILCHEETLYPLNERYTREQLESFFNEYLK